MWVPGGGPTASFCRCLGISGNDAASTRRSFLKLPPAAPFQALASCSVLSACKHLRIILFSEFKILQHQVQSPCGPRRKLLSTRPSPVKSPTPTPPRPGPRLSLAGEQRLAPRSCLWWPQRERLHLGVCLGNGISDRLSLFPSI